MTLIIKRSKLRGCITDKQVQERLHIDAGFFHKLSSYGLFLGHLRFLSRLDSNDIQQATLSGACHRPILTGISRVVQFPDHRLTIARSSEHDKVVLGPDRRAEFDRFASLRSIRVGSLRPLAC